MKQASATIKASVHDFLAEQTQPIRIWDIANGIGYSISETRKAVRSMVDGGIVECIKSTGTTFLNPKQGRTTTGFDTNRTRNSYLYRLIT